MPVAKTNILSKKRKLTVPKISPAGQQTIVHNDKVTPIATLLTNIDGSPWEIDYFQQVLNTHTTLADHDTSQSGVYQQYYRIKQLEVRVTSPISLNFDNTNNQSTVTGSATMYPTLIPNVGDVFIADIGTGKKAQYRVSEVKRLSIYKESLYEIDYNFIDVIDGNNNIHKDLVSKSINTYVFSKKRLITEQDPHLVENVYDKIQELQGTYTKIIRHYFREFYDRRTQTFITDENSKAYDENVSNFIFRIIEADDIDRRYELTHYGVSEDMGIPANNIFNVLLERDPRMLQIVDRHMVSYTKGMILRNSTLHNAAYLPIRNFITTAMESNGTIADLDFTVRKEEYKKDNENEFSNNNVSLPDILQVNTDTYLFSNAFYNNNNKHADSIVEKLIKDYLEGTTIDIEQLCFLTDRYHTWSIADSYYYIPILLLLIKTYMTEGY